MPLKTEVLAKYLNPVFVETGTAYGNGVQTALECGFKEIYSTEPLEVLYKSCLYRFEGKDNIHLYNMNSTDFLTNFFTMNSEGHVTFWLDAHRNGRKDEVFEKPSPIMDELNIIYNMMEDDDFTILIDDIRLFRRGKWGVMFGDLLDFIKEHDLQHCLEDGYVKDDVMVIKANKG